MKAIFFSLIITLMTAGSLNAEVFTEGASAGEYIDNSGIDAEAVYANKPGYCPACTKNHAGHLDLQTLGTGASSPAAGLLNSSSDNEAGR